MDCSCPRCNQGLFVFRLPSAIEKEMLQLHHFMKTSHNLQSPLVINPHLRPECSNNRGHFSNRNKQTQREHSMNDSIRLHQNNNGFENVHFAKRNAHGSVMSHVPICHVKPIPFCSKETHPSSSSDFKTECENVLKTHQDSCFGMISHSNLSRPFSYVRNSLDIKSPWSEIEEVLRNDNNESHMINPRRSPNFRDHPSDSSEPENSTSCQSIHANKSMINTLPIKGILKPNSQSSYSSFINDLGSDGEATASNNSQRSSESSSLGSKSSSKKRVHFEERVITKIIWPFLDYTFYDNVFHDEVEPQAINDIPIRYDFQSAARDNYHTTNTDGYSNVHQFGKNSERFNEVKMEQDVQGNEFRDKGKSREFVGDFKGHRDESEISFLEALQNRSNSYHSPFTHVSSLDDHHHLKMRTNGTLIKDNVGRKCSAKHDECKTAFPYCPDPEVTNTHLGTMTRGKTVSGQNENDTKKLLQNLIDDKQSISFPQVKSLQAHNLSPEEKTIRILEWLDDVKESGRHRHISVPLLVIPRPLVRRASLSGEYR